MKKLTTLLMFLGSLSSFAASEGVVEFYLAPSRRFLDWSTPKRITRTFISSRVRAHELNPLHRTKTAMGHGMVHFKCTLPNGEDVEAWSGLTGQSDSKLSRELVFKKKIGINVLFHTFEDGYIQKEEEVLATLASYKGRHEIDKDGYRRELQPVFLRSQVTPETCQKLNDFYQAYKAKAFAKSPTAEEIAVLAPAQRLLFGLPLEPLDLYTKNGPNGVLGGGCTSYATSFLKLTGIYTPSWDQFFKREVAISSRLMGNEENPVSIFAIFFRKLGNSWDHGDQNLTKLNFYDSEKIWDFYDTLSSCAGDERALAKCTPEISDWLSSQGLKVTPVSQEVAGNYKKRSFKNIVRGVEIHQ